MKKIKIAEDSTLQEVVFACNSSTFLCECHGMEIAIGTLTFANLDEIAMLIRERIYLESNYFQSWFQFDDTYHENGVFLDGSDVEDLEDKDGLSTSNFKLGEVIFNDLVLDDNLTYLCTFRNETIYNVSKGLVKGSGKKIVDCEVTTFGFLETATGVSVAILNSSSVKGAQLPRNSADEEDSGEIYDIHQFLIKNGKIVFFASSSGGQYPFNLSDSLPNLNSDADKNTLKKIVRSISTK